MNKKYTLFINDDEKLIFKGKKLCNLRDFLEYEEIKKIKDAELNNFELYSKLKNYIEIEAYCSFQPLEVIQQKDGSWVLQARTFLNFEIEDKFIDAKYEFVKEYEVELKSTSGNFSIDNITRMYDDNVLEQILNGEI